jgi:hypothetical protein
MLQKHRAVLHTDMTKLWSDYIHFPASTREEMELVHDYEWLVMSPSICPDYGLDRKMQTLKQTIARELTDRERFALSCDHCGVHDPRMYVTSYDQVVCQDCESELCYVDIDCMVDNYIID